MSWFSVLGRGRHAGCGRLCLGRDGRVEASPSRLCVFEGDGCGGRERKLCRDLQADPERHSQGTSARTVLENAGRRLKIPWTLYEQGLQR